MCQILCELITSCLFNLRFNSDFFKFVLFFKFVIIITILEILEIQIKFRSCKTNTVKKTNHNFSFFHFYSCRNTAVTFKYPCFPIKFKNNKPECTGFARSQPACHSKSQGWNRDMRNQVNTITSYVDGSQIYGNDEKKAKSLRLLDGKNS